MEWVAAYERDFAAQASSGPVTFTDEQRSKNRQLLEKVRDLMPLDDDQKVSDCDLLYRFLIGRHWDVRSAEQFVRQYVQLRREKHVNGILAEEVDPRVAAVLSPVHGVDKDGQPILWLSPDPSQLLPVLKSHPRETLVRAQMHVMEAARFLSKSQGVDRCTYVLDLGRITMSSVNSTTLGFLRELIKVLQEYYPEIMRRLLVFNTGWAITGAWKVLKPFVDARVQDKIRFYNSAPSAKSLGEFMTADNMIPEYGGTGAVNVLDAPLQAEVARLRALSSAAAPSPPPAAPAAAAGGVDDAPAAGEEEALGTESPRSALLFAEELPPPTATNHSRLFTATNASSSSTTVCSDGDGDGDGTLNSGVVAEGERNSEGRLMENLSFFTARSDASDSHALLAAPSPDADDDDRSVEHFSAVSGVGGNYFGHHHGRHVDPDQESISSGSMLVAATSPSTAATATATAAPVSGSAPAHRHNVPPQERVVVLNMTEGADGSVVCFASGELVGEFSGHTVVSSLKTAAAAAVPPTVRLPPAIATATVASPPADNDDQDGGAVLGTRSILSPPGPSAQPPPAQPQCVVAELLRESGHPIHNYVIICDARRKARFVVRKSRLRSRVSVYQIVGDATVCTDSKVRHTIAGQKVKMGVAVPPSAAAHRRADRGAWRLYGEDLARRRAPFPPVWPFGRGTKGNSTTAASEDAASATDDGVGGELLGEYAGQAVRFYGVLSHTHPADLFALAMAIRQLWLDTGLTGKSTAAGGDDGDEEGVNVDGGSPHHHGSASRISGSAPLRGIADIVKGASALVKDMESSLRKAGQEEDS